MSGTHDLCLPLKFYTEKFSLDLDGTQTMMTLKCLDLDLFQILNVIAVFEENLESS